ncbi:hypothetical protein GCM10022217_15710 [Chryseobacterium ginsenosidimutans]|uniref:hypothetical protein n=1 Tax=Chryseobacterium ginsenosidimutans TaxID=687846 RepID=UPI0031E4619C
MKVQVLHNQSFLDIAIQYTGDPLTAFDIAYLNNMSISEPLSADMILDVPKITNTQILSPATEMITDIIEVKPLSGVGYWEIETEFTVG